MSREPNKADNNIYQDRDAEVLAMLVNYYRRMGGNLLHRACINASPEVAAVFLNEGYGINDINSRGDSPLFSACYPAETVNPEQALKMVRFLISKGADVNFKHASANVQIASPDTPVKVALSKHNAPLLSLLLVAGAKIEPDQIEKACEVLSINKAKYGSFFRRVIKAGQKTEYVLSERLSYLNYAKNRFVDTEVDLAVEQILARVPHAEGGEDPLSHVGKYLSGRDKGAVLSTAKTHPDEDALRTDRPCTSYVGKLTHLQNKLNTSIAGAIAGDIVTGIAISKAINKVLGK